MAARMMMKMQVPAYWPVVEGDHLVEYSGVFEEENRVSVIRDIESTVELEVDMDMSITQTGNN